jgi:hypothetical protein
MQPILPANALGRFGLPCGFISSKTRKTMKKIFVPSLCLLLFTACQEPEKKAEPTTPVAEVKYAYPMEIGKNWEIGDQTMGQKVTELWKMYDDNTLASGKSYFADTVTMMFPGTPPMTGNPDSVVAWASGSRAMYASVQSSVRSVVSLKDKDNGETWATIWGMEKHTDAAGKTDSVWLHEAWQFNKDGKINFMVQYANKR